jgi:flavin-dependent dehydrogenase
MAPCNSMRIAWRASMPAERSAITNPYGCGWHIKRKLFDDWLVAEAAREGARIARPASVSKIVHNGAGWQIDLDAGGERRVFATVVVDACGRSGRWRWPAATRTRHDALCTVVAVGDRIESASELLIEAVPDGWCYSVAAGDCEALVGFVTDADILVGAGGGRAAFSRALEAAPLTARRIRALAGDVVTTSACTTSLQPAAANGWIAVGDAALAHEPLAGQGILFALRSATRAAFAVRSHLDGDARALASYASEMRGHVAEYARNRRDVYGAQGRWRGELFWKRRTVSSGPGHMEGSISNGSF